MKHKCEITILNGFVPLFSGVHDSDSMSDAGVSRSGRGVMSVTGSVVTSTTLVDDASSDGWSGQKLRRSLLENDNSCDCELFLIETLGSLSSLLSRTWQSWSRNEEGGRPRRWCTESRGRFFGLGPAGMRDGTFWWCLIDSPDTTVEKDIVCDWTTFFSFQVVDEFKSRMYFV